MSTLKTFCIVLIVAVLLLSSIGSIYAAGTPGPPDGKPDVTYAKGPPDVKPNADKDKGPPEGKPDKDKPKGPPEVKPNADKDKGPPEVKPNADKDNGPPEGKPNADKPKGPPEVKPNADKDKGPPEEKPKAKKEKNAKSAGKNRGFSGNVTEVIEFSDGNGFGNVTLLTNQNWTVVVELNEFTRYKLPRGNMGWISDFDCFVEEGLNGNFTELEGRRVGVLAGNVTGEPHGPFTGVALKFMLMPQPGTPPHAHRTGNVTEFNLPDPDIEGSIGNITIVDLKGFSHFFVVDGNTTYRPSPPEMTVEQIQIGSFVTVVTIGNPKHDPPAKAIVLHRAKLEE
ncbi:MAG: hypothetical protein JSV02_05170 [Dehalococcoidia bacterium]|nr:MAG: hypothetical protein JSV02_05170 [Dehalococcoidia bacterium]